MCAIIVIENNCQKKRKTIATNQLSQPSLYGFIHLEFEHKKIPPYPIDIWVPSLPKRKIGLSIFSSLTWNVGLGLKIDWLRWSMLVS